MALTMRIEVKDTAEQSIDESSCTILSHETQLHALQGTSPPPSCDDDEYVYASSIGAMQVRWDGECTGDDVQCQALRHLFCPPSAHDATKCDITTSPSSLKFYEAECVKNALAIVSDTTTTLTLTSQSAMTVVNECPMLCQMSDTCTMRDITTTLEMLQDGMYVESERQRSCEDSDASSNEGVLCTWDRHKHYCVASKSPKTKTTTLPSSSMFLEMNHVVQSPLRRLRRHIKSRDKTTATVLDAPPRFKRVQADSRTWDLFNVRRGTWGSYKNRYVMLDQTNGNVYIYKTGVKAQPTRSTMSNRLWKMIDLRAPLTKIEKGQSKNARNSFYNKVIITDEEGTTYNLKFSKTLSMTMEGFTRCYDLFKYYKNDANPRLSKPISTCVDYGVVQEEEEDAPQSATPKQSAAIITDVAKSTKPGGHVGKTTPATALPISPKVLRPRVKAVYDLWLDWNEERSMVEKSQRPCLPTPTIHDNDRAVGGSFEHAVIPFGAYVHSTAHGEGASIDEAMMLAAEQAKRQDGDDASLEESMSLDLDRFRGMDRQSTSQCFACKMKKTSRGGGVFGIGGSKSLDSMDLACTGDVAEISRRKIFTPPQGMREQFESNRLSLTDDEAKQNLKEGGELCDNDMDCLSYRCKKRVFGSNKCVKAGIKVEDEPCDQDEECLSAECKKGMFGSSGTCTHPSARVMKQRNSDLFTLVEKLIHIVYRYAASRELIHRREEGGATPWYTSCDEYSLFTRESGALSIYGGVLCSKLAFDTKCVRWYVDRFVDAPVYGEAAEQFREVIDQWDVQSLTMLKRAAANVDGKSSLGHLTSSKAHALHIQGLYPDSGICRALSTRTDIQIKQHDDPVESIPDNIMAVQSTKSSADSACWAMDRDHTDPIDATLRLVLSSSDCVNVTSISPLSSTGHDLRMVLEALVKRSWEKVCGPCDTLTFRESSAYLFPRLEQLWRFDESLRVDHLGKCTMAQPTKEERSVPACWEKLSTSSFTSKHVNDPTTFAEVPTTKTLLVTSYPAHAEPIVEALKRESATVDYLYLDAFSKSDCEPTKLSFTVSQKTMSTERIGGNVCIGMKSQQAEACKKALPKKLHYVADSAPVTFYKCKLSLNEFSDDDSLGPLDVVLKRLKESTSWCEAIPMSAVWKDVGGGMREKNFQPSFTSPYESGAITFVYTKIEAPCTVWYQKESRGRFTRSSTRTWHKCVGYQKTLTPHIEMTCTLSGASTKPVACDREDGCSKTQSMTTVCGDVVTFDVPPPQELVASLHAVNMKHAPGALSLDNPALVSTNDDDEDISLYQLACFPKFDGYANTIEKYLNPDRKCKDYVYTPAIVYNSPGAKSWSAFLADDVGTFTDIAKTIDPTNGPPVAETLKATCSMAQTPLEGETYSEYDQGIIDALKRVLDDHSCALAPLLVYESLMEAAVKVARLEQRRGEIATAYGYFANRFYASQHYSTDSELEKNQCASSPPGFPS